MNFSGIQCHSHHGINSQGVEAVDRRKRAASTRKNSRSRNFGSFVTAFEPPLHSQADSDKPAGQVVRQRAWISYECFGYP